MLSAEADNAASKACLSLRLLIASMRLFMAYEKMFHTPSDSTIKNWFYYNLPISKSSNDVAAILKMPWQLSLAYLPELFAVLFTVSGSSRS
jgi:hypothetical protein